MWVHTLLPAFGNSLYYCSLEPEVKNRRKSNYFTEVNQVQYPLEALVLIFWTLLYILRLALSITQIDDKFIAFSSSEWRLGVYQSISLHKATWENAYVLFFFRHESLCVPLE